MDIRENALGPEHPDVAASLNNLALLYRSQGRSGEAEPLLKRALDIEEKALGPEYSKAIETRSALFSLIAAQAEAFQKSADGGP